MHAAEEDGTEDYSGNQTGPLRDEPHQKAAKEDLFANSCRDGQQPESAPFAARLWRQGVGKFKLFTQARHCFRARKDFLNFPPLQYKERDGDCDSHNPNAQSLRSCCA